MNDIDVNKIDALLKVLIDNRVCEFKIGEICVRFKENDETPAVSRIIPENRKYDPELGDPPQVPSDLKIRPELAHPLLHGFRRS